MASSVVAQPGVAPIASWKKEILGPRPSFTASSRRSSASSIGSRVRVPPGHWKLPISGNCPGCHHHHKSVEIHVDNINNSSQLVDLHCENCKKLWLGPGMRRSATRLSLMSTATIEPPSMEPEVRVTLARMIRATTRVATLSPTLHNIQEGVQAITPDTTPRYSAAQRLPNRITKPNPADANVNATRSPRIIRRINRRLGKTFPILKNTRLGRLLKLHVEHETGVINCERQPCRDRLSEFNATMLLPQDNAITGEVALDSSLLETLPRGKSMEMPLEIATQGRQSRMVVDQGVINDMSSDQRNALYRFQIAAFRAQQNSQFAALSKPHDEIAQSHPPEAFATLEAICNSLLAGVGGRFVDADTWYAYGDHGLGNARPPLDSETNISEEATAVEGREFAPQEYLPSTLHRRHPPSPVHERPTPADSSQQPWQESRQDHLGVPILVEPDVTNGTLSRSSETDGVDTLMLVGTEASPSQSQVSHTIGLAGSQVEYGTTSTDSLSGQVYREWS